MSKTIYISEKAKLTNAIRLLEKSRSLFSKRRQSGKASATELNIEEKITEFLTDIKG